MFSAISETKLNNIDVRKQESILTAEKVRPRAVTWTQGFSIFSGDLKEVHHDGYRAISDVFKSGRADGWRKKMKEQNEREAQNPGEKELLYSWNAAQNLLDFIEGGQDLELEHDADTDEQDDSEETNMEVQELPVLERLERLSQHIQEQPIEVMNTPNKHESIITFDTFTFLLDDDESFENSSEIESIHDINEGYQSSQSSYTESKCDDYDSVKALQL